MDTVKLDTEKLDTEKLDTEKLDPKKNTLDKSGNIRFDYIFSFWVFAWFLIYYFTVSKNSKIGIFIKTYCNPSIALYFAFIENILTFIVLLVFQNTIWTAFKFLIMMISIKIIPIYLLRNEKLNPIHGLLSLGILFSIYNIYLFMNDTNIYDVYSRTIYSLIEGKNETPLFHLVDVIMKNLKMI
jgi:hypothetical protein